MTPTDDDTLIHADYIATPFTADRPRTFHDEGDEDWIRFFGRQNVFDGMFPENYIATLTNLGNGVKMFSTDPDLAYEEGTGLRMQVYDINGMVVMDPQALQPIDTGIDGCNNLFDMTIGDFLLSLSFSLPADDEYFLRISQCRDDFAGNTILIAEDNCITDDASYEVGIGYESGDPPGVLSGFITDAVTALPIVNATISSIDGRLRPTRSYSQPPGFYELPETVDDELFTGTISNPGYVSANIQFRLVSNQITNCDVALVPEGGETSFFADGFESPPPRRTADKGMAPPDCTQL